MHRPGMEPVQAYYHWFIYTDMAITVLAITQPDLWALLQFKMINLNVAIISSFMSRRGLWWTKYGEKRRCKAFFLSSYGSAYFWYLHLLLDICTDIWFLILLESSFILNLTSDVFNKPIKLTFIQLLRLLSIITWAFD